MFLKARNGVCTAANAHLQNQQNIKPTLLMKNLLSVMLVLTTTPLVFGQGKLCFCNNIDNLIYFGAGAGFPLAGRTAYTGPGSTIAALPGSPAFVVGLWAGPAPSSMTLQATTTIDTWPGQLVPVNVTFPTLPAGTPAYFQIQIYDSLATNAADAFEFGGYGAETPIFQATPQASVYSPLWIKNPPVNSTWAPGTFVPVDLVGYPGYYGGIEIGSCLGPYWMGFIIQPTNQILVVGATATFYVRASACPKGYCQWYFNGLSIPGATGMSLQVTNAQLSNAGTYSVVLSNSAWGTLYGVVHEGGTAILTVVAKPSITSPPQSQTAETGATVRFYVSATDSLPLSYQWFFNSAMATPASTNNWALVLTNVQPSLAGAYAVVVTNGAGAVTSSPAMLNVIVPVERRPVWGVKVTGESAGLLNVDYANSLRPAPNWTTVGSLSLTNPPQYCFDLALPLPPQRFYRAWRTGTLGVRPSLELHLVPAITLTGGIGHSVRLDYINQFGPIDAWVTLDTVTLTNTSQLYFDVSAPGQPQRLYRLIQVP
jgi:hypothetical protein